MQLSTHNGTHLDAPWHFHSTQDAKNGGSRPSITIDQVPLEWCFQPGVKLDFRHLADGYVVTAADVEAELKRIGHTLSPLEIVVSHDNKASEATISVVDHGEGIPKQLRAKIFERFYRSDNSRNRDTGGSGLGLAIVKGIIERHSGTITAVETPGG